MRQFDIVFGILLIHPIINFALAAPIAVQENHQTCVDVVHMPRDVISVLAKRWDGEELWKVAEYFKSLGLEDPHTSSSSTPLEPEHRLMNSVQPEAPGSAPLGPEHGSTNDEQEPAPNSTPSTANPNPLVEAPSQLSTPTSSEYGSPRGPLSETFSFGSFSTSEFNELMWQHWNELEPFEDPGYHWQEVHVHQPDAGPLQQVADEAHGAQMDGVQLPQQNGMVNGHQVVDAQQPNPRPSVQGGY